MKVGDLRRKVFLALTNLIEEGDAPTVAAAMTYARLTLIALAERSAAEDVQLDKLEVGTETAALMLDFHPEHLRFVLRHGAMQARKENGEYRIAVSEIAGFTAVKTPPSMANTVPEPLTKPLTWLTIRTKQQEGRPEVA
jgi:hypothetical protein